MEYLSSLQYFGDKERKKLLLRGLHGLEKESLRVTPEGDLALTPHPKKLSNPLSDPHITTDFSESQLEFITSPFSTIEKMLGQVEKLHRFTVTRLGDELIWPFSMPARLPSEADIPIARYGSSKEAQEKETYRRGLALRYGKYMQTISGIHYNTSFDTAFWKQLHKFSESKLSLQEFMNDQYLHLARNFIRYRWLLVYLFGSSPVLHKSYCCPLMAKGANYATSLRLSRCGYSNPAKIRVRFNHFKDYLADLVKAVDTPHPPYAALGLEKNGERVQMNDHLLQIGNEYYAPLRLKPPKPYHDVLQALQRHGVRYVEARIFDLDPFEPLGITADKLYFSHLFLLFCLLSESPFIFEKDLDEATSNQLEVALNGRKPSLALKKEGKNVLLEQWGEEILQHIKPLAQLLDENFSAPKYMPLWRQQLRALRNPALLPSYKIVEKMKLRGEDFIEFGIHQAKLHRRFLKTK